MTSSTLPQPLLAKFVDESCLLRDNRDGNQEPHVLGLPPEVMNMIIKLVAKVSFITVP